MSKRSLWKRLAAIAASATMLISMMGSTVMGFGPNPSQKASITVHKYSRTSESTNTNPTGEELTDVSGLGTALAGAGFTIYPVTMPTLASGENYTGTYTVDLANSEVKFDTSAGTKVGTIGAASTEQITDANGQTKFGGLDQGYYVLVESTVPGGYDKSPDTVISLPLTNKAGTGFVYDVHVYPKNVSEEPITKLIDDATKTYKVGDFVDFTINAGIANKEVAPNDVKEAADLFDGTTYGEMKIKDTLVGGLKYDSSTLKLLKADNTSEALISGTDYNLTGTGTGDLVWELTPAGIDKAIAANAVSVEVKLHLEVLASAEALTNSARSYVKKPGSGDPTEPVTPPVTVPTGNVTIDKIDADGGAPLENAIFAIATNASATEFLKPDGTTVTITDQSTLASNTDIIKATTGTDGKAIISGLVYDASNGSTYRLVEIQAPAGYQLKEAAINADLAAGETAGTNVVTSVVVKNYANGTTDPDNPKFALPLTGGTGTVLFTAIGVLIMATVIVVYIRSKKRQDA
ncbi:MAG TPA: SpaH/EbpB family LPXTG-anchored major pilin [Candidatus Pelethocola excrementipullorum]|nr:SpaH/EbpB family LPXTG-anchored major pilin [Candidatus Pelethocola excrementipullorum]